MNIHLVWYHLCTDINGLNINIPLVWRFIRVSQLVIIGDFDGM